MAEQETRVRTWTIYRCRECGAINLDRWAEGALCPHMGHYYDEVEVTELAPVQEVLGDILEGVEGTHDHYHGGQVRKELREIADDLRSLLSSLERKEPS